MADEYIKREDVMKALFAPEMCYTPVQVKIVKELPAADVAVVGHAKWILDRYPNLPARECSRCTIMIPRLTQLADPYWQYCPNCGARMDGGDTDGGEDEDANE